MDNEFDPVAASGAAVYRAPRALELNEVSINGDAEVDEISPGEFKRKGGYFRKRVLVGKPRDQKPEEINLGEKISGVFLKVRRKLVQRGEKGKIIYSTSEHDKATDVVDLYDENGFRESGNAKALRERYPGLRTVQNVYGLLAGGTGEPELVRYVIRGSSLGSENKEDTTTDFYKFISSKFEKDEQIYEFVTDMTTVLEKGAKSYFCINFAKGQKLDEKYVALAIDKLREVHTRCVEMDKSRVEKRESFAPKRPEDDTETPTHDPALDEEGAAGGGTEVDPGVDPTNGLPW